MSYLYNKSWYVALGIMLLVLLGIMWFGFTQVVRADERGSRHQEFRDSNYGHNRYYPSRGQFIATLPSGHRTVFYGNKRYYSYGGVWYRPQGPRFVVTAPPFGMIVPVLPPYYATIWIGGLPYYYANEIYYTQGAGGYIVVEPPKGEVNQAPPSAGQMSSGQLFIYPRQGQSEQKQATDRYECHRWAVSQTGYDPMTQPPASVPAAQMSQKRADYQRAMGACLDGLGYTVK
ncbi:MAG: hypothetical protein M0P16_09785 [Syntrophales bacterium]|nr:hypothetical protein [Syntrophales bacterium]